MFRTNAFRLAAALLVLLSALMVGAAAEPDRTVTNPTLQAGDPMPQTRSQAPVGHRQPTAADVVGAAPAPEQDAAQKKRDRALDRKLQICRGC